MNRDIFRMCVKAIKGRVPVSNIQAEETFWLSRRLMTCSKNNHLGWVNTAEGWLHLLYIKCYLGWSSGRPKLLGSSARPLLTLHIACLLYVLFESIKI